MILRHYATAEIFVTACGVTTDPADLTTAQTIGTGDVTCPACLALIAGGYLCGVPQPTLGKRAPMSAATREKIGEAVRENWRRMKEIAT